MFAVVASLGNEWAGMTRRSSRERVRLIAWHREKDRGSRTTSPSLLSIYDCQLACGQTVRCKSCCFRLLEEFNLRHHQKSNATSGIAGRRGLIRSGTCTSYNREVASRDRLDFSFADDFPASNGVKSQDMLSGGVERLWTVTLTHTDSNRYTKVSCDPRRLVERALCVFRVHRVEKVV